MGKGRRRNRSRKIGTETAVVVSQTPTILDDHWHTVPASPPPPDLVQVMQEDVAELWPLAEELLASEIPETDWTAEQLCQACAHGVANLWLVCDQTDTAIAAMVTILTPAQRCLVAICSGKNLWDFVETRHQLYAWAKDQGMKEVTFYGRPALAKLMPECKRAGIILRKEL